MYEKFIWPEDKKKALLWKERVLPHLVKLEERINALKGKVYPGYGFHYGLEGDIKYLLREIQHGDWADDLACVLVIKVRIKMLTAEVVKAEKYVEANKKQ